MLGDQSAKSLQRASDEADITVTFHVPQYEILSISKISRLLRRLSVIDGHQLPQLNMGAKRKPPGGPGVAFQLVRETEGQP